MARPGRCGPPSAPTILSPRRAGRAGPRRARPTCRRPAPRHGAGLSRVREQNGGGGGAGGHFGHGSIGGWGWGSRFVAFLRGHLSSVPRRVWGGGSAAVVLCSSSGIEGGSRRWYKNLRQWEQCCLQSPQARSASSPCHTVKRFFSKKAKQNKKYHYNQHQNVLIAERQSRHQWVPHYIPVF